MAVHLLIVVYGLERIAAGISRPPRRGFGKEAAGKAEGKSTGLPHSPAQARALSAPLEKERID